MSDSLPHSDGHNAERQSEPQTVESINDLILQELAVQLRNLLRLKNDIMDQKYKLQRSNSFYTTLYEQATLKNRIIEGIKDRNRDPHIIKLSRLFWMSYFYETKLIGELKYDYYTSKHYYITSQSFSNQCEHQNIFNGHIKRELEFLLRRWKKSHNGNLNDELYTVQLQYFINILNDLKTNTLYQSQCYKELLLDFQNSTAELELYYLKITLKLENQVNNQAEAIKSIEVELDNLQQIYDPVQKYCDIILKLEALSRSQSEKIREISVESEAQSRKLVLYYMSCQLKHRAWNRDQCNRYVSLVSRIRTKVDS